MSEEIELLTGRWDADQSRYIEWLATPRYERVPPNADMLAAEMGRAESTLYKWRKIDGFQDAVNQLARKTIGIKLPEVYGALLRQAEAGSFEHIRLALELAGEYTPRQKNLNEASGEIRLTFERKGLSTLPE